jgi:hypothetical protein
MSRTTEHPAARAGADRAGRWNSFGETSNSQNNPLLWLGQAVSSGPVVPVHLYVSRRGNVGFWIEACPLCGGYEHTHTGCPGFVPFDPRDGVKKHDGWRMPHCGSQSPDGTDSLVEYRFRLAGTAARFTPGAERSRRARKAMNYLRSIGIATSDETIPSARPLRWWRWR